MRSLCDRIELYLKTLIERSEANEIEIQRIELAETFNCVPSQITYVLGTRFTKAEGFVTESKRGGRGFVRIRKMPIAHVAAEDGLTQSEAERILSNLQERNLITERECLLLRTVIDGNILDLGLRERNYIRARMIAGVIRLLEV
jgi:transcriptional regulator CtsR